MERNVYLALGDSITAGYGASHPSMTFVRQVSDYVRKKSLAQRTIVMAQNGWTSHDLLRIVCTLGDSVWGATTVITLLTGGNDLRKLLRRQYFSILGSPITPQLVDSQIHAFSIHLNTLCGVIRDHSIPQVILATVYNPVPNSQLAVTAIEGLNDVIRQASERHHFKVVDVHEAFHQHQAYLVQGYRTGRFEDLVSPIRRPIHPNNAGHLAIAELFMRHLEKATSPPLRKLRRK